MIVAAKRYRKPLSSLQATEAQQQAMDLALIHASANGSILADQLVSQGASPLSENLAGRTALMEAAAAGHDRICALLAPLSNPKQRDPNGNSPLQLAAWNKRIDCVKILLPFFDARDADLDGSTALMGAASHGDAAMLALLLPCSDIQARCGQGRTAADYARKAGHERAALAIEAVYSRIESVAIDMAASPANTPSELTQRRL